MWKVNMYLVGVLFFAIIVIFDTPNFLNKEEKKVYKNYASKKQKNKIFKNRKKR